jgi:hypothetical protein
MPQLAHVVVAFLAGALLNNLIFRHVVILLFILLHIALKAVLTALFEPLVKLSAVCVASTLTYIATGLLPPRNKIFTTQDRLLDSSTKQAKCFRYSTAVTPSPSAKLPHINDALVQEIEKEVQQHGQSPHISRVARLILEEKDHNKRKSQLMADLEKICQSGITQHEWPDKSSNRLASAAKVERPLRRTMRDRAPVSGKQTTRQRSASDPLHLADASLTAIKESCEYVEVTAYPQSQGIEYASTFEVPRHHEMSLKLIEVTLNNVRLRLYQLFDDPVSASNANTDNDVMSSHPMQLSRRRPRTATGL